MSRQVAKRGMNGKHTLAWRLGVLAALLSFGCGGARLRVATLDDVEHVRATPAAQESAKVAPGAYAHAEDERRLAREAHADGDDVGAGLHAERAIAAYEHALAAARLARATSEVADAQKASGDALALEQSVGATRGSLDADAADLEARVRVARERILPAPSARETGEREAARAVAASSLAMQGRLLCGAARLVATDADGLAEAEGDLANIDDALAKGPHAARQAAPGPRPALIDDAARARAKCLDVLVRARRAAGGDDGRSDALLADLSASGAWDPSRDERGVVVALRGVFRTGAESTDDGGKKLADLGRVAAAHPAFAVQVVVHDAQPPAPKSDVDARRADAVVRALVAAGATASRVKAELAGARAPLVDPSDAKSRARNERIEIVFVAAKP